MAHFLLPYPLTISEIKVENAVTQTFTLDGQLTAIPGQFVMAWLPGHEDKPFSLAGTNPVKLVVAAVGPFSQALHTLNVGDRLWLRGPLGRGYQLPTAGPGHLLLIGGGYGVAPLLFLAREALTHGHRVSAIIGARRAQDLVLAEEFAAHGVPLWLTTEDGSRGQTGLVTEAIPRVLSAVEHLPPTVYSCGPVGMLAAVAALCQAEKIPFQLGWEAHMRCGVGLCGSCEVGQGWLTCLDGPVFPFNPVQVSPNQ
jgi:dihydroorotate dehydrogenase electron transfer subunit